MCIPLKKPSFFKLCILSLRKRPFCFEGDTGYSGPKKKEILFSDFLLNGERDLDLLGEDGVF